MQILLPTSTTYANQVIIDLGKVLLAKPTLIEAEAPNDPKRAFPKRALTCTMWLPNKKNSRSACTKRTKQIRSTLFADLIDLIAAASLLANFASLQRFNFNATIC